MTVAAQIAPLLPAHRHYVEPFAGSLAVLLAKPQSRAETANDLDEEIVTFFRVLRDQPEDLARACALTPHSRAEYEASRKPAPEGVGDVERARRFWVRITQSRGHVTSGAGWRVYEDGSGSAPNQLADYVARMAPVAARLARVSLECRPALEVVAAYGRSPGNLLYVDPPYLVGTRSSRDRYAHEMKGEAGHRELAAALRACLSAVVLSGYSSRLYAELYWGWDRLEIATETGNAKADRSRIEVLWSNRPFPVARQDELFDLGDTAGSAP